MLRILRRCRLARRSDVLNRIGARRRLGLRGPATAAGQSQQCDRGNDQDARVHVGISLTASVSMQRRRKGSGSAARPACSGLPQKFGGSSPLRTRKLVGKSGTSERCNHLRADQRAEHDRRCAPPGRLPGHQPPMLSAENRSDVTALSSACRSRPSSRRLAPKNSCRRRRRRSGRTWPFPAWRGFRDRPAPHTR